MDTTTIPGSPCWIELFTHDTDGARRFYPALFGWEAWEANPEFGGYFMFAHEGAPIAGCMPNDGTMGGPSVWGTYLHTADAAATVAAVTAHGGKVDVEPMPVGDAGTMAWISDPTGGAVGLWQPADHPGFVALRAPGTPAWFELHTDRYEAAVEFYRDALGWDLRTHSDAPDFRFTTNGPDEAALCGIEDAAASLGGGPSHWVVYLAVAAVDAPAEQARALGGAVTAEPEDTPYGRIAEIADPAGLSFRVLGPSRS